MAYSKISTEVLKDKFGLSLKFGTINLFNSVVPVAPSAWLHQSITIAQRTPLTSEKERSERVVSPILIEIRERNNNEIGLYSGASLDADKKNGLSGECDFIITNAPTNIYIDAPILAVVEAKKNDIEQGIAQCAAQMLGAKMYNQRHNNMPAQVFGCITTGEIWQFACLHQNNQNNIMTLDNRRLALSDLPQILGVLQVIIDFYKD